jgi:hypothetical protein
LTQEGEFKDPPRVCYYPVMLERVRSGRAKAQELFRYLINGYVVYGEEFEAIGIAGAMKDALSALFLEEVSILKVKEGPAWREDQVWYPEWLKCDIRDDMIAAIRGYVTPGHLWRDMPAIRERAGKLWEKAFSQWTTQAQRDPVARLHLLLCDIRNVTPLLH